MNTSVDVQRDVEEFIIEVEIEGQINWTEGQI